MSSSPYDSLKHVQIQDILHDNLHDALKELVSMNESKCVLFKQPIEQFNQGDKQQIHRHGDILVGFYADHGDIEIEISSQVSSKIRYERISWNIQTYRLHIKQPYKLYYAYRDEQVINLIACDYNSIYIRNESKKILPRTRIYAVYAIIDHCEERQRLGFFGNILCRLWKPMERENNAAKKIQTTWRRVVSDPSYVACKKRLLREFQAIQNI